jgi:hypothetical protein
MLLERMVPSDLRYNPKRKRRGVRTAASRRPSAGRSLDSVNHLATSDSETFAQWRNRLETAQEKRNKLYRIWERLLESLKAAGLTETYLHQEAAIEGSARPGNGFQEAAKRSRRGWSAWRDFERVSACQTQWKGFQASCCGGRAVAVPIGCNHRLCPLCNAHRAEHYRERVKELFAKMENPQLLTLTVPNVPKLNRGVITRLRGQLRSFLKQNKALILGGVYSIEITRNASRGDWHPHIHCLVDLAGDRGALPYWKFMERKWRLEFDWLLLTQGKREEAKREWMECDFDEWVAALDPRRGGRSDALPGYRRSVDIRPVSRDKKAAYEVMKYMTKVAFFVGDARALAEFCRAVKGVRAIQTFGSCYGCKVEKREAKSTLSCECGQNKFEDIGILGLGMVAMSPDGRWYVRDDAPVHGLRCRNRKRE